MTQSALSIARALDDIARKRFAEHQRSAKRRGIPFLLTFEEWWGWWQTDDRWSRRGVGEGKLVMARYGDVGPYAVDNVYCCTHAENAALGARNLTPESIAKQVASIRAGSNYVHLRMRQSHPRSRQVISPAGIFPSVALAAEANGIKAAYASKLANAGTKGWSFGSNAL